jgi:hypothetical protein
MRKPKCPSCGKQSGIPFVHGEVSGRAVIAQAERGEIALCGCALSGVDPDWQCAACSQRWRARGTKAKKKSSEVLLREMMEGLREHGLPARRRMLAAEDMADRLAPRRTKDHRPGLGCAGTVCGTIRRQPHHTAQLWEHVIGNSAACVE